MKREDLKKIRELSVEALRKRLSEEETKALKLKLELRTGKAKDLHAYAKKRKEIALINTMIAEKKPLAEAVK